jgi:lipopolysaccharide transport system ATP-binding protein
MSNVIVAQSVGKSYVITHDVRERYATLRDTLTRGVRRLGRRLWGVGGAQRVSREEFWALRDVSFEIQRGDRVGVIGRNGAGKSTLLKVLSRITEPTRGRIELRGRVGSLLEVGTGFHPELTGRENVFLNGAILGMSRAEIASKFDEIVAFAEVERFIDTPVKRYSSGMYVRLAFAVAAHLEPEILIVDEVLSVGDIQFQKKCLGKIEDVGREGRTVLFVSHAMAAVSRLCSKCVLLRSGELVSFGDTESVIRQYLAEDTVKATDYALPADARKDMQLRGVSLNPEAGARTTDLRYDEPFVLRIEYDVNRPVSDCLVWLALQTIDGVIVFVTTDHDVDQRWLERREPGRYRADVEIPGKWLNVGEYTVLIGVVRNNPVEVFNREETISFEIVEIGTPGSITKEGVRRGVLQPYLPWTTEKTTGAS